MALGILEPVVLHICLFGIFLVAFCAALVFTIGRVASIAVLRTVRSAAFHFTLVKVIAALVVLDVALAVDLFVSGSLGLQLGSDVEYLLNHTLPCFEDRDCYMLGPGAECVATLGTDFDSCNGDLIDCICATVRDFSTFFDIKAELAREASLLWSAVLAAAADLGMAALLYATGLLALMEAEAVLSSFLAPCIAAMLHPGIVDVPA